MSRILVTGGAKRLGAQICLALAQAGYSVVVHYRSSKSEADAVAHACSNYGVEAEVIQGDFSTSQGLNDFFNRFFERFSSLHGLINNVGNYFVGSAVHTLIDKWLELFQLNLNAPVELIQKLLPFLMATQGSIINIGVSGLNRNGANTYCTAYMLAKESLWGLTRSLSLELAEARVKVNMISPGLLENSVDLQENISEVPFKRAGSCEEVARVITFLLDPKNEYITGQNIEIAGGFGLK